MIKKNSCIRLLFTALLFCSLVLTAGCDKMGPEPTNGTSPKDSTGTLPFETEESQGTTQTEASAADASLISLRQAMIDTDQLFAVAYLGDVEFTEHETQTDPVTFLRENLPGLCADLPFLLEIPKENIVGETGELFCIIPKDENASVVISKDQWDTEKDQFLYDDIVYSGNSGDPVLLLCNNAGWEPDTRVYISGASGEVIWYPQLDDNRCVMSLQNESQEEIFHDFSPYREMLLIRHEGLKDEGWVIPTAEVLSNTTWCWYGYLLDGPEVSYRLLFEDEILSVFWNDGIDIQDHEYLYAPWELYEADGFGVLSIDFGEFAGVLRYNLLYHDEFDMLYVELDLTQEDMPIGFEPLYRFLSKPVIPEPVEMIGTWDLAWTQVEGEYIEAEPDSCTITIQSAASGVLLMSYTSWQFPDENFQNEALAIDMREMHHGCGNDVWVADVDWLGPYDTFYAVTLTSDGTLIKQNYFTIDGAPAVSYEYFYRAEE